MWFSLKKKSKPNLHKWVVCVKINDNNNKVKHIKIKANPSQRMKKCKENINSKIQSENK